MRGLPSTIAWTALLSLSAAGLSCSNTPSTSGSSGLSLAPTIVVPKGLADELKSFSIQAYNASPDGGAMITCDPTTGKLSTDVTFVTGLINGGKFDGMSTDVGCGAGSNRCFKNVTIPQDVPLAILVTGYSGTETMPAAYGCYTGVVTTATVSIQIAMEPIAVPEMCGNGTIEPPETCDPKTADGGTNEFCSSTCQTSFDLLSSGTGASGSITITGNPGDKADPFFLWPATGNLLAFFSDNSTNMAESEQISLHVRGSNFGPTNAIFGDGVTQTESIYLPHLPSSTSFPPAADAFAHKQPVAVRDSAGVTHVAFTYSASGSSAIALRSYDSMFNPGEETPCTVSDASGDPGNLTSPSAALTQSGSNVLYIAWQDASGRIFGRTYTPGANGSCGTTGAQTELSTGSDNSHVSVAGTLTGWIVAWQSASLIELRPVNSTGTPTHVPVNIAGSAHSGATPTIASLSDGRYAVAWSDTFEGAPATIVTKRFSAGSAVIDGDPQATSVSTGNGGELTPYIAASSAVGGSYVIAWVDGSTTGTEVRGRVLAGGALPTDAGPGPGFLHNAIDGTTGEFVVSEIYPSTGGSTRTRVSPTVAVGGDGYIAFGWADNTSTGTFGIIGRRFPLPTN